MHRLLSILSVAVVFFGTWQAVVWIWDMPVFLLPGPGRTATALWHFRELIARHAGTTLLEIGIGLVTGIGFGILTAICLAMSPAARRHLRPWLIFLQAVPFFVLAPVLTFWMGFGIWPKVVMAMLIIYFPVTSTFFDGLMNTPRGYLDLARTMGASPWRTLVRVRIPAAVPALASALKLGAVFTPIGAVIGEWVGGSGAGLGYLMVWANGQVKTDLMFAAVFVLATCTVLLYAAANRAGQWLVARYG